MKKVADDKKMNKKEKDERYNNLFYPIQKKVIRFFIPATTANDLRLLEKEPVFPFLMFSAKQINYRVPFL